MTEETLHEAGIHRGERSAVEMILWERVDSADGYVNESWHERELRYFPHVWPRQKIPT